MLHLARQAFDEQDYDTSFEMLDEAEAMDPSLKPEIDIARSAIDARRKAGK
jgi:hypothetical protein